MRGSYPQLAKDANDSIRIQAARDGIMSVIQFESSANIIYQGGTSTISESDCSRGGTDFSVALRCALAAISRSPSGYECRIVFFTDGGMSIPTSEFAELRARNVRLDAIGYGDVDQAVLPQLPTCGEQVTTVATMDQVGDVFRVIAAAN
jgi:uncharacterized protein with von Willebrand factor type A (vWA) domain